MSRPIPFTIAWGILKPIPVSDVAASARRALRKKHLTIKLSLKYIGGHGTTKGR